MVTRITVRDQATGNSVEIDLEPHNTVDEIIESVANYFEKDLGAYVVVHNQQVIKGEVAVSQLYLNEGDTMDLILDPEGG